MSSMKHLTLSEINNEMLETVFDIRSNLDEDGVIIDVELHERLTMILHELHGGLEKKHEAYIWALKNQENFLAQIEAQEAMLAKLKESEKKKRAFMERLLLNSFALNGDIREVKTASVWAKVRKDLVCEVTDADAIPEKYLRIIPEKVTPASTAPDKTAIKAAIKAGEIVPGAIVVESVKLKIE